MNVDIKLLGILRGRTPPGGVLTLPADATLDDALQALALPTGHVQAVAINGRVERDRTRRLSDGDRLVILPPVSGGS
jgi:sulfur carrier protein ThiS